MQLVGKFLGDQIARIYEKIGLHTGDSSIHRTSAEIRAEITEGDIPPEIARQTEVERALAGKVDKIDGKELMPSPGEGLSREYYLNASGQWEKISSDALVITMTVSEDQQHFSLDENELGAYLKAYYGIDSYEDVRNPDTVHSHIGVFLKYAPYGVKYKEDGTVDNIYTIWNFIKVTRTFTEYGIPHLMAYVSEAGDDGVVTTGYYCQIDIWDRGDGVLRPSVLYSSITSSEMTSKSYVDETKAGKSDLLAHVGNTENPHRVTKAQIGLENVENTADADKPVSKPVQQALDGIAGQLQSHAAESAIHRTSAQIRAEITDADIPGTIARDADVDTKIQAHNESGEAHADLRNALANLEGGTVEAGSAVYAQKLGTAADSYTKTQLDAKLNRHIKDVVYDAVHAKFTFVFEDGREIVVDTPLENTVTDGRYDNETLELVLVLVSGQEIRIPVAGMTKVYTGKDTATATTTINDAGEVSVALKTGGVDTVHLSGALLSAINSHLTSTGDTKDNITTFPDQGTRTNLASGDKHAVLFGKIKRWFSDLKTVAFTGKASDLSQDAGNRLVTDAEKAGWNDKYTRAEVDTKDAGKANLVHTHTKAQITDFPTALPANGGNADMVDGVHADGLFVTNRNDISSLGSFVIRPSGTYRVLEQGANNLLVVFRNGSASNAALEIYSSWSVETSNLKIRTVIDANRYSVWKSLAYTTDIPASLPANGGNADTVDRLHATDFGRAYSGYYSFGGNNNDITTDAFVDMLASLGAFDQPYWVARGSWEYDNNSIISDTGIGRIHLSGCVVEVFGVRSNYTIRIITPTSDDTGAELRRVFIYINNNNGYNYGWFKLANVSDIPTSLPASDVYAWAKQANKPTYNINEIYDADGVRVDAGTVNRKIFIANYKSEGYLSRAAIGLTNPIAAFSPVIISAGMDDQGNTWADWVFDPANGRITNPNGKAFAYTEEIPNVSNYLPLSGGAMAGMLSTCAMPGTFIEGMTRAAIKYNNLTTITNTAYHSFLAMKAQDNHILNFGGIGNDIGFRGYLGSRTQNGYDYRLSCNTADGSWTLENGRFYINSSTDSQVIMFQRNNTNKGFVGLGNNGKGVYLLNFTGNCSLYCSDDGKCYYNDKEIATTDQINHLVTLNTSQTITGAKIFTQYCDFRAGAGNSGSDMRFKEKVRPVDEVLPGLLDLKVICYEWNKEGEQKRDTFGISATELEEKGGVFEKIVHERDDEQRTKWVEYDRVGVLALKGMQEMYHRWEAEKQELHRELADLKAELAELRGFLHELK